MSNHATSPAMTAFAWRIVQFAQEFTRSHQRFPDAEFRLDMVGCLLNALEVITKSPEGFTAPKDDKTRASGAATHVGLAHSALLERGYGNLAWLLHDLGVAAEHEGATYREALFELFANGASIYPEGTMGSHFGSVESVKRLLVESPIVERLPLNNVYRLGRRNPTLNNVVWLYKLTPWNPDKFENTPSDGPITSWQAHEEKLAARHAPI